MWSQYGPRSMLVANGKLPSAGGSDAAEDIKMPYVVNDIATFFTLLVGIYFPSVTGESLSTFPEKPEYRRLDHLFLSPSPQE